jgi:2'-5' RNA ligase
MDTDTSGSLRLFFALWPDATTRAALMRLQTPIQGRLTSYENLHLTLAFLGQQPAALLPELKEMLDRLPRTSVLLKLDRVGYFTRKRIVWAGMHQAPEEIFALRNAVAKSLAAHEIAGDTQGEFRPHVTLARDAAQPPDTAFTPVVWQANHLTLVKSVTSPEGPRYQVLASRSLEHDVWVADESGNDKTDG